MLSYTLSASFTVYSHPDWLRGLGGLSSLNCSSPPPFQGTKSNKRQLNKKAVLFTGMGFSLNHFL